MKQIRTEIEINAPKEKVWNALIAFDEYQNWNPFIFKAEGEIKEGNTLQLKMKNGKREMEFQPTVLNSQANQEFQWLGSGMAGTFKGQHYFKLEERNGKTKLIHGEDFSGLLSGIIFKMVGDDTRLSFIKMNEALKNMLEKDQ